MAVKLITYSLTILKGSVILTSNELQIIIKYNRKKEKKFVPFDYDNQQGSFLLLNE